MNIYTKKLIKTSYKNKIKMFKKNHYYYRQQINYSTFHIFIQNDIGLQTHYRLYT